MADIEKIKAALAQLDPLDDDQWTADGAPKVETVSGLVGEAVKRQDIVNAAPDFNREKASKGPDDDDEQLKDNGPTVEEYVKAGYSAKNYPPQGFASKSTDEEIAAAIKAEEDKAAADAAGSGAQENASADAEGSKVDPKDPDPEGNAETETDTDFEPTSREMSASEFMEWIRKVPKEELEGIEAALKSQHDEVGAEIKNLGDLQKRISQAVSITRARIKEAFPNTVNQHAIREFIAAQAASRAERVARRQTILKGLKPDELEHRSPLDAAMARKTKRGTQRPVRAVMK